MMSNTLSETAPPAPTTQSNAPWIILGIGNDFRGDDAFGLAVVDRLNQPRLQDLLGKHRAIKARPDVSELLGFFQQHERILLIDALYSHEHTTGTHLHFDLIHAAPTHETLRSSTHLVSIQESVALAKVLDLLPRQLHVMGITSTHFELGEPLSAEAEKSIEPTCQAIIQWLKENNSIS